MAFFDLMDHAGAGMETLEGIITSIIYHNEENGYTVCELETDTDLLIAVGNALEPAEGRKYRLQGKFRVHRKYGEQFAFKEIEEVMPESEQEVEEFLGSGAITGVGPKMARSIVAAFGEDTFRVMREEPERLTEVSGIGKKKAAVIAKSFASRQAFSEVSLFFQKYGITSRQAMKLFRTYGEDAVLLIRENPYRLITEVRGIGFRKADEIAVRLGIAPEDPKRIRSGIRYILTGYSGEGNTYVPQEKLLEEVSVLLDLTRDQVDDVLIQEAFDGDVKVERINGIDVVYLYSLYMAEKKVAADIMDIAEAEIPGISSDIDFVIRESEAKTGIRLSAVQEQAVRKTADKGFAVITGGPGTGKSTIIRQMIALMESSHLEVALAAPTGRAAKRITETSGRPASTIHRLLGYTWGEDEEDMFFEKNREDPLECDALIVDEASMIDLMLMKALTEAVRPGTRLILVGDADQLPSVGPGNVLKDIIESDAVTVVQLREVFRQAKESDIVMNAHRINSGEYPVVNRKGTDFFMDRRAGDIQIRDTVIDLVTRRLPGYYKTLDPVKDIQVLTPKHKGQIGTDVLNEFLQRTMNPPSLKKTEKKMEGKLFREGDKVMQIRNDYQLSWNRAGDAEPHTGVYNGDVGFIQSIDLESQLMTVVFDEDKFASYEFSQLDELELAYAITVHKSQGSEFPVIVIPIGAFPPMLASRNLLYTAVTRGEKAVVLVGEESRLRMMVDNNRIKHRNSGLKYRLDDLRRYCQKLE